MLCCCWVTQLCPTLRPMDCCLPGSSAHWVFQARILEWGATPFSRGSSQLRDQTRVSCIGRRILYRRATREVQSSAEDSYNKGFCFFFFNFYFAVIGKYAITLWKMSSHMREKAALLSPRIQLISGLLYLPYPAGHSSHLSTHFQIHIIFPSRKNLLSGSP